MTRVRQSQVTGSTQKFKCKVSPATCGHSHCHPGGREGSEVLTEAKVGMPSASVYVLGNNYPIN